MILEKARKIASKLTVGGFADSLLIAVYAVGNAKSDEARDKALVKLLATAIVLDSDVEKKVIKASAKVSFMDLDELEGLVIALGRSVKLGNALPVAAVALALLEADSYL